ncbi:MAG TPA: hypothetical protein PK720_04440 [bacterium]|nr:hypothetical protein [bacterium]
MEGTSKRWKLNSIDWKKVGVGATVALGGAALTYSQEIITQIDFGKWTEMVMVVNSILVNIARKWIVDHSK